MFREHETIDLATAVGIILVITGVSVWYETWVRDGDSVGQTIFAIGQWLGISISAALASLASFEVARIMLAKIYTQRIRAEALAEERQRWEAWLKRKNEAEAKGEKFDEPPPPPATE